MLNRRFFCIRRVCVRADKIIMFLSLGKLFRGLPFFINLFIERH